MEPIIRPYAEQDAQAVIRLSLDAWAPVFASQRDVMGAEIFERLHGDDWSDYQRRSVESVLAADTSTVWVATVDGGVAGFVAADLHEERRLGEISMLAVAPEHQRRGIGTELTSTATDWIRGAGMLVAMVETGGDPGHAPARSTYERASYALVPVARYFKAL
jgi:GNAT superfamily N-acetyltransferase